MLYLSILEDYVEILRKRMEDGEIEYEHYVRLVRKLDEWYEYAKLQ